MLNCFLKVKNSFVQLFSKFLLYFLESLFQLLKITYSISETLVILKNIKIKIKIYFYASINAMDAVNSLRL